LSLSLKNLPTSIFRDEREGRGQEPPTYIELITTVVTQSVLYASDWTKSGGRCTWSAYLEKATLAKIDFRNLSVKQGFVNVLGETQ
jgi:hypothetical protein